MVNDRGAHPIWDFAGFYGTRDFATIVGYADVERARASASTQIVYRSLA